jgi:hypothetical protein
MATASSVPDYSLKAREALSQAEKVLMHGSPPSAEIARAQAFGMLGVGYAILAVFQQLPQPPR